MFPSLFSEPSGCCLCFGMNIFHVETHTSAISVYDVCFFIPKILAFWLFIIINYYYYLKIMEYFTNLHHPCAGSCLSSLYHFTFSIWDCKASIRFYIF